MAQINWTDRALEDIDNIIQFYVSQSENYAKVLTQRIFDKVELLNSLPWIGRVVPELEFKFVREIIVGSHRIVYHIVSKERIDILRVHHSSLPLDIQQI